MEIVEPNIVILPKEFFHIVEERLDAVQTQRKITWTDRHNVEREIRNLSDEHARKLSYWCETRGLPRTRMVIKAELERRATGTYPTDFEAMIKTYKQNPEIWRLKVY